MHPVIEDIILDLASKYNLSRYEIERMIDCEFKMLAEVIANRGLKKVKMIHLGIFQPSNWFRDNHHRFIPYSGPIVENVLIKEEDESPKEDKGNT